MDNSPFNGLPAEIRNRIYEFALHEPYGIPVTINRKGRPLAARVKRVARSAFGIFLWQTENSYNRPALLGLPRTCKQIRRESLQLYFGINELFLAFEMPFHNDYTATVELKASLQKWFKIVRPENAAHIKCVRIALPHLSASLVHRFSVVAKIAMVQAMELLGAQAKLAFVADLPRMFSSLGCLPTEPVNVDLDDLTASRLPLEDLAKRRSQSKYGCDCQLVIQHDHLHRQVDALLQFIDKAPTYLKDFVPGKVSEDVEMSG